MKLEPHRQKKLICVLYDKLEVVKVCTSTLMWFVGSVGHKKNFRVKSYCVQLIVSKMVNN